MNAKLSRRALTARSRRRVAVVVTAVALAGTSLAPAASAVSSAAQSASGGLAAAVPATTSAGPKTSASDAYVAVVAEGTRRHLRVVSRSSGQVLRTLSTSRVVADVEPYRAADLAPDGSVWAVFADRRLPSMYQTRLVHIVGGKVVRSLPYVTSVRVSPDGGRLAVSVLAPATRRGGQGRAALQTVRTATGAVSTLASTSFPTDAASGWPTIEVGGLQVQGWADRATLVVRDGCCDSGNISLVPADVPSRVQNWPVFAGSGSTMAVGVKAGKVLVVANRWAGDGSEKAPFYSAGVDAFWVSKARPKGTLAGSVKGLDLDVADYADSFVRAQRATPLWIGAKRFPYRGTGTVSAAYL